MSDSEPPQSSLSLSHTLLRLLAEGLPVTLGYVLQVAIPFSNTYFLGTLGTQYLAAGTLAIMVFNCTGLYVGWGALLSMDTLMSQAVGLLERQNEREDNNSRTESSRDSSEGDEQPEDEETTALLGTSVDRHLLSVLLQRAILLSFFITIPIIALWTLAPMALKLLGQDAALADLAGRYLLASSLGLLPNLVAESQKKYLQSLGWMKVHFVLQLFSTPLHILLAWRLTSQFGFIGPALALSATYGIQPILFALIIYYKGIGSATWGSWFAVRKVLDPQGLVAMMRLALPGIFMLGAEYWAYEVIALAAGLISPAALAAQSVILLTMTVTFQLPFGLSIASGNRIGNLLGSGRPDSAQTVVRASLILGLVYGCVINPTILLCLRINDAWGRLFDEADPEVQRLITLLLIPAAFIQPADSLQLVFGGVVRGVGLQEMGAWVNLGSYYLLGLPLALFLAFKWDLGLNGLWIGLAVALYVVAGAMGLHLWRTLDLRTEADKVAQRSVPADETESPAD